MKRAFSLRIDPYTKEALRRIVEVKNTSINNAIESMIDKYIKEGNYEDLMIKPLNLPLPPNTLKTITTTVLIDQYLFDQLEKISKELGYPISAILRRLILKEFKRLQEKSPSLV